MPTPPSNSTEWASDGSALVIQPSSVQKQWGWSTDDNTVFGTPVRPNLQNQNGWQKNVHEWVLYLNEMSKRAIPLGGIIAIADNLTGTHPIPATGVVDSSGFMLCDGSAIPGGNAVSGSVPDLTDDRFLMGSGAAGGTGGANDYNLTTGQLPAHDHGAGTFATSLGGTFASTSHTHAGSSLEIPFAAVGGGGTIEFLVWRYKSISTRAFEYYLRVDDGHQAATSASYSTSLEVSGNTGSPSSNGSLTGSNSVTGTSGSNGSGDDISNRPKYLSTIYLMRVD